MVSLKLFVDDVVVVHLSVCAGNSLSSMHHLMMRFEARAQNNTHIGNGKNPCTKVESRWREEREKNVQRAHIFLLCCLMVARKKRKKREKNIYTQYNKRYVWIGWSAWRHIFSDGAHMLINRAHWAKLSERENESWKLRNTEKSRHCRRAAGIHFYTLELCALCARIGSLFSSILNFTWWYATIPRAIKNVCTQFSARSFLHPKIGGRDAKAADRMKRKKTRISLVSKAVQTSARGQIYIYNKKNTPFVFIRHQRVRIKSAIHLTILRGKMSPVRCLSLSAFSIYDRVYLPQITFLFTYSIKMWCVCAPAGKLSIDTEANIL